MKATGRLAQANINNKNIVHVASSSSLIIDGLLIIDITARTFVLLGKIVRTSGLQNRGYAVIYTTLPFQLRSYTTLRV